MLIMLTTKILPKKRKGGRFLDETIVGSQPMVLNSRAQRGTPALRVIGKKDPNEKKHCSRLGNRSEWRMRAKVAKSEINWSHLLGICDPLCAYVIPLTPVMAYSLFCETTYHHLTDKDLQNPRLACSSHCNLDLKQKKERRRHSLQNPLIIRFYAFPKKIILGFELVEDNIGSELFWFWSPRYLNSKSEPKSGRQMVPTDL